MLLLQDIFWLNSCLACRGCSETDDVGGIGKVGGGRRCWGRGARLSLGHRQQSACQQLRSTSSRFNGHNIFIVGTFQFVRSRDDAQSMVMPKFVAGCPPTSLSLLWRGGRGWKGNMGMRNCPELSFKSESHPGRPDLPVNPCYPPLGASWPDGEHMR